MDDARRDELRDRLFYKPAFADQACMNWSHVGLALDNVVHYGSLHLLRKNHQMNYDAEARILRNMGLLTSDGFPTPLGRDLDTEVRQLMALCNMMADL